MSARGWYGVDLDGTLAEYHGWQGGDRIGAPIPRTLAYVKARLQEGADVRIVTARVSHDRSAARMLEAQYAMVAIMNWCIEHIGQALPVTCEKDYAMVELLDDRAVQLVPNTGQRVDVYAARDAHNAAIDAALAVIAVSSSDAEAHRAIAAMRQEIG